MLIIIDNNLVRALFDIAGSPDIDFRPLSCRHNIFAIINVSQKVSFISLIKVGVFRGHFGRVVMFSYNQLF